jgi:iron complex outermembrane recepter protein
LSLAGITDYTIPLGSGDYVDLIGSASYKSRVFFDLANDALIAQDGFWLFDARASYVLNEGQWFSVYGRNLSDEEYRNFASQPDLRVPGGDRRATTDSRRGGFVPL